MNSDSELLDAELAKFLPVYRAYRDRSLRRQDDEVIRDFLVVRIKDGKSALDRLSGRAVENGNFDRPAELEQLRNQLENVQTRLSVEIRDCPAFFADIADPAIFDELAKLDRTLLSLLRQIDQLVKLPPTHVDTDLDDRAFSDRMLDYSVALERRERLLAEEDASGQTS